ncbi:MAG TPA: DUF2125 domain-containing protein [Caulobacteraceae bacterium]|jgi:hypothetical protein
MTTSEKATPRRASRLGLYGPFVALAIALAAWSAGWWWLKGEAERALDGLAARQLGAGGALTWQSRSVHGYPFRLDVDFTDIAWREPSGWAIAAPKLKSEASAFASGHWVAFAPDGVILGRPTGGAVRITAKVLRASLSDQGRHPPTFSIEGIGLAFAPTPGAAPYFLLSAAELHVHTRAGPSDQGAFLFELDRATPSPGSALGRMAAGKSVTLVTDAIFSHAGALSGPTWARAIDAWSGAGGRLELRRLHLAAGDAAFDAHGAELSVGSDGRLEGTLDSSLRLGDRMLTALMETGVIDPAAARMAGAVLQAAPAGGAGHTTLTFQAGRTTLGPVAIGPAPKVY